MPPVLAEGCRPNTAGGLSRSAGRGGMCGWGVAFLPIFILRDIDRSTYPKRRFVCFTVALSCPKASVRCGYDVRCLLFCFGSHNVASLFFGETGCSASRPRDTIMCARAQTANPAKNRCFSRMYYCFFTVSLCTRNCSRLNCFPKGPTLIPSTAVPAALRAKRGWMQLVVKQGWQLLRSE